MTNEIRYQMIQNNTKLNTLAEEDELKHYGTLGMKWGVRRYQKYGEGGYIPKGKAIAQKTYNKSIKKLDKLDSKVESAKAKSASLKARGTDLAYKGQKQQTFSLTEIGYAKGQKNSMKASKLIAKSAKKDREAIKAEQKADKWSKKMLENLKGIPAELTDAQKRTLEKHGLEGLEIPTKNVMKGETNPVTVKPTKSSIKWNNEDGGFGSRINQKEGNDIQVRADNEAAKSFVDDVIKDKKSIQEQLREKVAKDYYDPDGFDDMTRDEFKKDLSIDYVRGIDKDRGEIAISDGPEIVIGGHGYYVEYDKNKKKFSGGSLEG